MSDDARRVIEKKFCLVVENPFRYKRLQTRHNAFRIRFSDRRKEKRAIYILQEPIVGAICILDRDKEYNDLEDHLQRVE